MNPRTTAWLTGFVAATISGCADFVVGAALLPEHVKQIAVLALFSGIKSGAAYLKQSPLPASSVEVKQTTTVDVTKKD